MREVIRAWNISTSVAPPLPAPSFPSQYTRVSSTASTFSAPSATPSKFQDFDQFQQPTQPAARVPGYDNLSYRQHMASVSPEDTRNSIGFKNGSPVTHRSYFRTGSDQSTDLRIASRQASQQIAPHNNSASSGPARTVLHDPFQQATVPLSTRTNAAIVTHALALPTKEPSRSTVGSESKSNNSDRIILSRRAVTSYGVSDLPEQDIRAANPLVSHVFPVNTKLVPRLRREYDAKYVTELEDSINSSCPVINNLTDLFVRAFETLGSYHQDSMTSPKKRDYLSTSVVTLRQIEHSVPLSDASHLKPPLDIRATNIPRNTGSSSTSSQRTLVSEILAPPSKTYKPLPLPYGPKTLDGSLELRRGI